MNPESYVEWCELSGLYLRNHSALDLYQTYAKKLSLQGLNTVIVSDFLSDLSADLNLDDWRTYNVYEEDHLQSQRVELTANALTAIGAGKIAEAVRTAKSHSPFDALHDIDPNDPEAVMQAFQELKGPEMLNHLRESMARMMPELAAEAGIPPTPKDATKSNEKPEYESREEIEGLLREYAAANQHRLRADVKKYGDPREAPGFNRERRLEELEIERQRYFSHEAQRGDLPKLQDLMAKIEKLLSEGHKKKTQSKLESARRKFLQLIKENRRHPLEMLLPEMLTLLDKAEKFIHRHPDVFPRQATDDKPLQARLLALGEHDIDIGRDAVRLHWADPDGLPCEWGRFELLLIYPNSKNRSDKALRALLEAVDRVRKHFAELSSDWRAQLIEHFRNYEVQMSDWELEDYELNSEDEVMERSILENAGSGTIVLQAFDSDGGEITGETYHSVEWDPEHGSQIEWEIPADETTTGSDTFIGDDVNIAGAGPQISEADISAFEKRFHIELPGAFRQFLLRHNGGKPEPNHIVLQVHGEKIPFDVDRFYSLTSDGPQYSLAAMLESARVKSLPASLLPIAGITYSATSYARNAQLCLVLSGKKKERVVLIEAEASPFPTPAQAGDVDAQLLAEWMDQLVENSLTVAKDMNQLFRKFRDRPVIELPVWLQSLRNNHVAGFLGWLDSGGQLNEKYTGYCEAFPKTVLDYLTQEASLELLREILKRKAIKPSRIRDSWLRYSGLNVARFRELMPILPKQVWPAVLNSPQVWTEPDLLEELAAEGVDFHAPIDDEGRPPLHHAVESGNKDAVQWLMNHGADPHQTDKYGRDAFVWAESGPGFECLPILQGQNQNAEPVGTPSPDDPGISMLKEAVDKLPDGFGLILSIQITTPAVTRIEKTYSAQCHYLLSIDIRRSQVTFKDMATPRQDYLYGDEWPTVLFVPILQWPELVPLWDTLEVRERDWQKAIKKRNYQDLLREDLLKAARSALEQAFDPTEAAARGGRLRKQ